MPSVVRDTPQGFWLEFNWESTEVLHRRWAGRRPCEVSVDCSKREVDNIHHHATYLSPAGFSGVVSGIAPLWALIR